MQLLKPTAGKISLALFLSVNIFFTDFLLSFYGLPVPIPIIVGYYDVYPGVVFVFLFATLLLSYFATSILITKLSQFWQATLLKTLLALFFELILYGIWYGFNIYTLIIALNAKENSDMVPPVTINPCPAGSQFANLCRIHTYDVRSILVSFFIFSLITALLSYLLSCTVVFLARTLKNNR